MTKCVSVIQVDISGRPPFPTGSKQFSGNFDNLLFLAGFNFQGHFEGQNEGFFIPQNESPWRYLSNYLSYT